MTSTEAPVMYPLSSDAKNATTSATSMGAVGEGQSQFLSSRVALLPQNPRPTPITNPYATLSKILQI